MELVLTLIRNVLAIPNEDPRFVTSTTTYLSHLQEDFIQTLHEENVYEMILLFAQVLSVECSMAEKMNGLTSSFLIF